MTGGSNGRYGRYGGDSLYEGEPIEPQLLAIARRLDHDGGTWRRGLPDEQRAARRAIAAIASAAPTAIVPAVPSSQNAHTQSGMPSRPSGPRQPHQPRQRGSQRAQRLLAVAAMLVVVVLLAVVLRALGSRKAGPHPTATATATATRAPTATSTPSFPGAWSVAGTAALDSTPDFAPSDPRVIYFAQIQASGTSTASVTLQRSDDAGKSWQTLAPPPGLVVDDKLLDVHLVVSADDARTAFLYSARTAASCGPQSDRGLHALPALPSAPRDSHGSGGVCLTQYRSGDGGTTWETLALPVPGVIAQTVYDGNGTVYALVAQPLYGSGNAPPERLIASTDSGLTWHVADASLWAQQLGIAGMAVAPSTPGTDRNVSVWAVTDPVALSQSQQAAPSFRVWRSDDGGTTWRLMLNGDLPYQFSAALVAGSGALYQLAPQPTNQGGQTLAGELPAVSTDGGATWTQPPSAGLPPSLALAAAAPVAAGARIVVPFMEGSDTVFYAWAPGAASWTQVAPPIHQAQVAELFAVTSGAQTTLWAIYGNTVASFTLG